VFWQNPGHGPIPVLLLLQLLGHGDEVDAGCGTITLCGAPTGLGAAVGTPGNGEGASTRCS